jgi:hypothetical protein
MQLHHRSACASRLARSSIVGVVTLESRLAEGTFRLSSDSSAKAR